MVRDSPLAEDLLQITFLSVSRARSRYEPGMRFGSRLLTIAANTARASLRHHRHVEAFSRERPLDAETMFFVKELEPVPASDQQALSSHWRA